MSSLFITQIGQKAKGTVDMYCAYPMILLTTCGTLCLSTDTLEGGCTLYVSSKITVDMCLAYDLVDNLWYIGLRYGHIGKRGVNVSRG